MLIDVWVCLLVCKFVRLFACFLACSFVLLACLPAFLPTGLLFVCLPACQLACLFACLSVSPFVCVFIDYLLQTFTCISAFLLIFFFCWACVVVFLCTLNGKRAKCVYGSSQLCACVYACAHTCMCVFMQVSSVQRLTSFSLLAVKVGVIRVLMRFHVVPPAKNKPLSIVAGRVVPRENCTIQMQKKH